MKKKLLFWFIVGILAVPALMFQSCDKAEELTKIDVNYDAPDVPLTLSLSGGQKATIVVTSQMITANVDSLLKAHNLDVVDNIKAKAMQLLVDDPADANFDFMESATVKLLVEGKEDIVVANTGSIQPGVKNIDLVVADLNSVKDYVGAGGFQLQLEVVTKSELPADPLKLILKHQYQITIKAI